MKERDAIKHLKSIIQRVDRQPQPTDTELLIRWDAKKALHSIAPEYYGEPTKPELANPYYPFANKMEYDKAYKNTYGAAIQ